MHLFERFSSRASRVRPLRVIATALVYPFYLVGLIVGALVWLALMAWAATAEGFKDGKRS